MNFRAPPFRRVILTVEKRGNRPPWRKFPQIGCTTKERGFGLPLFYYIKNLLFKIVLQSYRAKNLINFYNYTIIRFNKSIIKGKQL